MNEDFDIKGDLNFGDVGFDIGDIDSSLFEVDFDGGDQIETRYVRPTLKPIKESQILYSNAEKLAKEIDISKGFRYDAFISGNFIFGDFIEAFLTNKDIIAKKMVVSTLSLSQNNIDSFKNLLEYGWCEDLSLIVSAYFYSNEIRVLIPYIYSNLDIDNKFQLAVAGVHTKTCQILTEDGRKIVIHGSANLRSSANVEQITIEENEQLYDFYDEFYSKIIDEYSTIRKPIRGNKLWNVVNK
nr:MAG TPA: NgoFVII restriction endonuclease [Caudoviricetes sp.]